jgi:leucyl-tRNA synthetase
MLAPMMPHLAEECWHVFGAQDLIAQTPWPVVNPLFLEENTFTLPIQVNGKRKGEITLDKSLTNAQIEEKLLALPLMAGLTPKKIIIVTGRIINVVI